MPSNPISASTPSPGVGDTPDDSDSLGLALAERLVRLAQIEALDIMGEGEAATRLVRTHLARP